MNPQVTRATYDEVMLPNYAPAAIVPQRGDGARLWDTEGREYVDFGAGIAVSSLGHRHPKVMQALTEQADKLWHVSNLFTNEPALRLASKLCEATFAERVFFCNSGAEANEAALKLVRKHADNHFGAEKTEIIAFDKAFHGRTLFTVSAGGQAKYNSGFGPLPGDITHLPFNDVAALEAAVSDKTCALILEPVQGEGGVTPATAAFLEAARRLCDKHNALLVFDEVQTGNGRCGTLYSYMNSAVVPDVLTTAKGLGGGFPIGALLTTKEYADCMQPGTHGSTYGGNPLGCAVAEAVFDEIGTAELVNNVQERSQQLRDGLNALNAELGLFSEVRGQGLLIGAEMAAEFTDRAREVVMASIDAGVLILNAGTNVLRFAPPLNISSHDMEDGLQRLASALRAL